MADKSPPIALVALAVFALLCGVGLSWWMQHETPYATQTATRWPATSALKAFSLTDHHGQAFNLKRLQTRWTLFFFGYTHCPDICPSTLAMLNAVTQQLEGTHASNQLQIVFVSVDPARDTVAVLKPYIDYFNPAFIGVTGTPAAITQLTQQFSLPVVRLGEGEDYQVDHSSTLILTSPEARQYAIFSSPHDALKIAQDLIGLIQ